MIPCGSYAFKTVDFKQLRFHLAYEHQQPNNHAADNLAKTVIKTITEGS